MRSERRKVVHLVLSTALVALGALGASEARATAHQPFPPRTPHGLTRVQLALLADRQQPQKLAPMSFTPCANGHAGPYPCENVDLDAFLPLSTIGGGSGNDVWGWTDPQTGKEYALMGLSGGVSFIDVSDPVDPVYLGKLPTHTVSSIWRDVEVYANHAYVVADSAGDHGLQVFDLTELRDVPNPPVTFQETAHYAGFGSAHTLAIDVDTGFAYANGSDTCRGGLHMIDIRSPENPTFAGCYSGDGYTHDAQCVRYRGPDSAYRNHEICFNSNEDTLTIVDVTNKSAPVMISRTPYPGSGYTHQGWLGSGMRSFALDDELDEICFIHSTWTRFFDVSDLDAPTLKYIHKFDTPAIDHNLFIRGRFVFESNYRSGLRILEGSKKELGFFDVYPTDDDPLFNGTWSNYPFFRSGTVIVSGIEQGLFVLKPNLSQRSLSTEDTGDKPVKPRCKRER
jgi:choice-of-anchor B domain-containing protein